MCLIPTKATNSCINKLVNSAPLSDRNSFGIVPDRNKPDSRNNKGVMDVQHRPKLAYYAVRRVWRPDAPLEW